MISEMLLVHSSRWCIDLVVFHYLFSIKSRWFSVYRAAAPFYLKLLAKREV